MSTPNKPRGGRASALTALKQLPPEKREAIWQMRSETADGRPVATPEDKPATNAQIRNRIATQFGIRLSRDGQLSEFWSWQHHQQRLENYNALLENFEEFYTKANPKASKEKVREAGIAFFLTESAANGDRESFTDVARLDQTERTGATKAHFKEREVALAEQKFLETKKAEQEKALELVLEQSKAYPEVQELFKAAFAALKKAKR